MGFFEKGNPIGVFVYFLVAALGAMFCLHPIVALLSLFGGIGAFYALGGRGGFKSHGMIVALFVLGTVLNPLFNHSGKTVLFFLNDNPITLESLVYGALSSASVVGVIYWFRAFSIVMTGDRLLYVFGAFSPKLALVLSMALRYIPLFGRQAEKISEARRAIGADGGDSIIDRIRSKLMVFWVMVTWTLENGITTADSMESRGYGAGKRSFFSLYRFRASDAIAVGAFLALGATFFVSLGMGGMNIEFYPSIVFSGRTVFGWLGTVSYGVLAFLPVMIKVWEEIRWKRLLSEI